MSNSIKETLQAILDEASEKIEQSDALDKDVYKRQSQYRCRGGRDACCCEEYSWY